MTKGYLVAVQGALAAAGAFLSDRLGILFPVLCVLMGMMVVDYITGMLASKSEALDHPNDPKYGWTSKKVAKGIIKKVGYICVIAVAMVMDYIIAVAARGLGLTMPVTAFFGLLVAVWYILNERIRLTVPQKAAANEPLRRRNKADRPGGQPWAYFKCAQHGRNLEG